MVGIIVAVVLFGASVPTLPNAAGADEIGTTKSQVEALEAQATSGATRIRALTVAYQQASLQAADLAQQVAADQAHLQQIRSEVEATRGVMREDAIISYTGGATAPPLGGYSAAEDPAIRAEYLEVAAGDLDDVVDQYQSQEDSLTTAEASLKGEQQASQAALTATAADRSRALSEAVAEQSQLTSLQSRLNQLVAAANLAAQQQAAPPSQGLPVGGGVVTVVRAIVAPSAPSAPSPPAASGGGAGGVWLQLRECESGDNYQENTGNGFYGAYQFAAQTWTSLGYPGRPDLEPPAMQDQAAQKLQQEAGWGQWPACAAELGLT